MRRFSEIYESNILDLDLSRASRCVHHALDNFGMEMNRELAGELKKLEKQLVKVLELLDKDRQELADGK